MGSVTHLVPFVAPGPPANLLRGQPLHLMSLIVASLLLGLGHPSLLQMLVQPEQVHGPEGSSQPGRELHPLLHFLPRKPVNVAVGQPRSRQSGDIGDKKTQRLGASPTEGAGIAFWSWTRTT